VITLLPATNRPRRISDVPTACNLRRATVSGSLTQQALERDAVTKDCNIYPVQQLVFPTGTHYLPLPSMQSRHMREMLAGFGVIRSNPYGERVRSAGADCA